ncbi:Lysosomal acid phosphatase-like protein, partial [Leptotrombidium deliense]
VHRHGDRNPTSTYANDHNMLHWLQKGLGALTEVTRKNSKVDFFIFNDIIQKGEKRMRHLGNFLRHRYNPIWRRKNELYVRSSRVDRCIKSVQNVINGAYDDDFVSHPIPIRNVAPTEDYMLNTLSICPAWMAANKRIMALPENVKWYQSYMPLLSYLTEKSGSNVTKMGDATDFYENLEISTENGLLLPHWVNETMMEQLKEINNNKYLIIFNTTLQQRLRAGI